MQSVPLSGKVHAMDAVNNLLAVCTSDVVISLFDVRNPTRPFVVRARRRSRAHARSTHAATRRPLPAVYAHTPPLTSRATTRRPLSNTTTR